MEQPLVSVLIVTWNRRDDVLETVQSVYAQDYCNIEIIVVDNASSDGTVTVLQQRYPAVRVLTLKHNAGASVGRNAGFAVARGEIVFLLDSDASLGPFTLSRVVRRFAADPRLGVVYCKIVNAYTGQLDQTAGWCFSEECKADQDREFPAYSFSEGGSAIRRSVLERTGYFWEELFFGREGEELSLRIWDAGYSIVYFPAALVYHRVSPERRVAGGERLYYNLRNSLLLYLAHYPWWMFVLIAPLRVVATFLRAIRQGQVGAVLRALRDVGLATPRILTRRRPVSNATARHYLRLQRSHGPLRWNIRTWLQAKA